MKSTLLLLLTLGCVLQIRAQTPEFYEIVLMGGRVMDPETGLDAVRNVGVRDDRIVEISEATLSGQQVIDVSGLVVAPGFIDLHSHGQTNRANEFQARDGVTTALELESGAPFLRHWLASRTGDAVLNFGATVDHSAVRWMAMKEYAVQAEGARRIVRDEGLNWEKLSPLFRGRMNYQPLADDEIPIMVKGLEEDLEAGALGIGVPVGYYPGATRGEIFRVYEFAAKTQTPVYSHVRAMNIDAIQEAIANAAVTGAPLHIVHLNSISLGDIAVALDMVGAAQKQGFDITTEVYPYTAASTGLASSLFDDGWQQRMNISYGDLQWESSGERLTEETFGRYRAMGGTVIIHLMKPEWISRGVEAPFTMIGSDGMPFAPGAHPRSAGTFSRVLGRYVRERQVLSLMDALAKMTIMPARRLEGVAPMASRKGRLQIGADADITVFDPNTIIDTATFKKDLSYSIGVQHVLVNGTFVVKNGETVEDVFPGRPLYGKYRH